MSPRVGCHNREQARRMAESGMWQMQKEVGT